MPKAEMVFPDLTPAQALNIVRQVCNAHLCNFDDRITIEAALITIGNQEREIQALRKRVAESEALNEDE